MTNQEALNLLFNLCLKGEKSYHPGYEWTEEYSEQLKSYFGGVDVDEYMRMFARRETKELFQQRKDITAEVQSALGMMLEKPVAKIERSNWQKMVIVDGEESRAKDFEREQINKFGPKGLFSYTFERLRYWNIYDPNCFVVVEVKPFDNTNESAKPYPFEVTSEMAIDFKYDQADLLYLAVKQEIGKLNRFTLYQPKQNVVLQQITDEEVKMYPGALPKLNEPFPENVVDGQLVNINNKFYKAIIPAGHPFDKTPAIRAGYIDNPQDDGKTKLSIFHAALPFAKKLLKTNSEVDLTAALVASPIPIRFADKCDEQGCNKGYDRATGEKCLTCHGTGKKQRPTSVAEEITVEFPESREDLIVELSGMFAYVHFPPEAAKFLTDRWDWCFERANYSIYAVELTTKSEVAQTARFHSRAEQGVNDALWPYSKHISFVCGYLSKVIASFTYTKGGFAQPLIPSNLRFETTYDAFDELKTARDAGASMDACAILQLRVMELILQDDPEALRRAKIEDQFNPFRGASENQILVMLQSPLVSEEKKIFYLNRSDILGELANEYPNFYQMAHDKQKSLIDAKVNELKLSVVTPNINLQA